jgi:ATP-dependent RNA helicase SUPV3L1/SUV3
MDTFEKLEDGTALIAFSRADVLKLKQKLQKKYTVSVIYGNLSPEVRRDEAKDLERAKSQILIATDAIAWD